jgi:small subunit ribosomal protein S20
MKIFLDYTLNMPVTKTAKRALKGSLKKRLTNALTIAKLEAAIRFAQKGKTKEKIIKAVSLTDQAAKKKVIHKNKAARIKSKLAKLMPKREKKTKKARKASSK